MSFQASSPRRQFLVWGGAAGATGIAAYLGLQKEDGENDVTKAEPAATKSTATQKPAEVAPVPAGPVHRDLFVPHLNTEFTLKHNANSTATCKLIEISPTSVMKTAIGTFVAFSLVFESHPDFLKEGGICEVTHPGLQPMQIFLSPFGKVKKDKAWLEAAFTLRA